MLSQVRSREEHPITYISRKLRPNERNYSTVEKEALAIKWSLDKLRYYLLGREFTLVTDHAPLKWMASAKDSNARVTRWFLALQDFRFKVDHRPGKEHANADALSRRDACLGRAPDDRRLQLMGKECDNPLPHQGEPRGSGGRRILLTPTSRRQSARSDSSQSPDDAHLARGRWRPGKQHKRRPRTHGRGEQEGRVSGGPSRYRSTRFSRRP